MRLPPRRQRSEAAAEAPLKVCPQCDAYLERNATACEHCGYEYPAPVERRIGDNFDDVDPLYARPVPVEGVMYAPHFKAGRPPSLRITYRTRDGWLSEWLCLFHPGWAGEKALAEWFRRGGTRRPVDIHDAVRQAHLLRRPPAVVENDNRGFTTAIPVWE